MSSAKDGTETARRTARISASFFITSLLVSVHVGAKIGDGRFVIAGEDLLKIDEIRDIVPELLPDLPVEFRRDAHARGPSQARQAALVAAGYTAEGFHRQADTGIHDGLEQWAGADQVPGERDRLLVPHIIRAGAVVLQQDVPELPGQSTLDDVRGQPLIVGHDIPEPAGGQVGRCHSVLGIPKSVDDLVPVLSDPQRHLRKRQDNSIRKGFDDRYRTDGGGFNIVPDQGFGGEKRGS